MKGQLDPVIAGAGPIGLAVAIHARLRGLRPIVLERRDEPLDKACGEGIMPAGVAALDAMGVRIPEGACRPFRGIRYVDGDLRAEGRFRGPPGLGVERRVLARALLERARELEVDLRFGCAVREWAREGTGVSVPTPTGTVRGGLLVGADGLHSRIRHLAGLAGPEPGPMPEPARFGIRRHFRVRPWSDLIEVHLSDGAEAYVTPVGPETVGVAFLFTPPPPATRGAESAFDRLLHGFPALRARLAGADALDRARGAGPLRQGVRRRVGDRVALVGDAAGYVDALTGQGLEIGFLMAAALVETLAAGGPLARYEAAYGRLTRRYYVGTELLLRATRRRAPRRGLVRLLRAAPPLFDRTLGAL